jgi:hypothetical protein
MFVVPCPQSTVLFLRERAPFLAACFLEEGFPVWEAGADSGGEVGLGVWVMLFVRVWEICSEPGNVRNPKRKSSTKKKMVMSFETSD